jgi:hypothetical protein
MMVLDLQEAADHSMHIYGVLLGGGSALLNVSGFRNFFYLELRELAAHPAATASTYPLADAGVLAAENDDERIAAMVVDALAADGQLKLGRSAASEQLAVRPVRRMPLLACYQHVVGAVAGTGRSAAALPTSLTDLPVALSCAVLSLLPVVERMRAAAVCRAWRRLLTREDAPWRTLDFPTSYSSELLLAAGRRAGSLLHTLRLEGDAAEACVLHRVLREASGLHELCLGQLACKVPRRKDDYENPNLWDMESWEADIGDVHEALRQLPAGAPLRVLRLPRLTCSWRDMELVAQALRPGGLHSFAPHAELHVCALAFSPSAHTGAEEQKGERLRALFNAAASAHSSLRSLHVDARLSSASFTALVDAFVAAPNLRTLSSYSGLRSSVTLAKSVARLRAARRDVCVDIHLWKEPAAEAAATAEASTTA